MIRKERALEKTPWSVSVSGWDQAWQPQMESLFCQGNGYLGVRCAAEETVPGQQRDTFIAGTYDSCPGEVSELPNLPDVLGKDIVMDGELLQLKGVNHSDYHVSLSFEDGLVVRSFRYRTEKGKLIYIKMERFVSLQKRHLLMQRLSVIADEDLELEIGTGINGQVTNSGAQHFTEGNRRCVPGRLEEMTIRANDSDIEAVIACVPRLAADALTASICMERRRIGTRFCVAARKGKEIVLEYAAVFQTSRDTEHAGDMDAGKLALAAADAGFYQELQESRNAWKQYWDLHDIQIDSEDPMDSCAVRFALYHLRIMTPVHDERMNIGAKGLSGEAYKCHTFWDTEMFLFSPWLYTEPEEAKRLLRYRYLTLPSAREKAASYGCEGSLFPWESAWMTDGEMTPLEGAPDVVTGEPIPIRTGISEIHVNADVAYAVRCYQDATGDMLFMEECGYEILLETGLYWASRASWNEEKRRYEINGVIGPDEYSESVSNNAYTNYMAAWNMKEAVQVIETLRQNGQTSLLTSLEIKTGAVSKEAWLKERAAGLYLPEPDETGLIPQDDSFLTLPRLDLTPYKAGGRKLLEAYNMEQLCGYQVSKQADVVMLLSVMPKLCSQDVARRNYEYYEACCVHDSSLSFNVHSVMAARLGLAKESVSMFQKAAAVDLNGGMSSAEGIHAAAMGGIWQCVVFGFAGVEFRGDCLSINPHLPVAWKGISFPLVWKGERLMVTVRQDSLKMERKAASAPLALEIRGNEAVLEGVLYETVYERQHAGK